MATSNSYDYTQDRDTIIRGALELCGVLDRGETLKAEDVTVCNRVLNAMLKAWVVHGLQAWKRHTYTIAPLVLSQKYYDLGTHETNTITLVGDGATATGTLANHGFNTGDLLTSTGAANSGYDATGATITVTGVNTFTYASTGTAADSNTGGITNSYATARPERILSADILDSSGNSTPLTQLTRDEYDALPNATTTGRPSNYHYERKLGAGRLYVWPVANSTAVSNDTVTLTYQVPIEDLDASTDTLDMPPEWIEPVIDGLAYRLGKRYGVDRFLLEILRMDSVESLKGASDYDVEDGSAFFNPDFNS